MSREAAEIFVAKLAALGASDQTRLRRSVLKPLDDDVRTFDLFTDLWWSVKNRLKGGKPAARLVAVLYPWHPQAGGWGTLGTALGRLAPLRHLPAYPLARARFAQLLATDLDAIEVPLFMAVRQLAQKRIALDWATLLDNLCSWHSADRKVQLAWANDWLKCENGDRYAY